MRNEARSAPVGDQVQQRCTLALSRRAKGTRRLSTIRQRIAPPSLPMMVMMSSLKIAD